MQVLELMKTHVTTTHPEATLGEAVDLMDLYQTPCLPVVDATRRLCGVLMEDDVLRAMTGEARGLAEQGEEGVKRILTAKQAAQLPVGEFMLHPVVSVPEHCEVRHAAQVLLLSHLTRLPVTDELGRVVGMLNRIDIIQAVFEQLL